MQSQNPKRNMGSPSKIRRKSILKFTLISMENSPRRCVWQLFSPNFAIGDHYFLFIQVQILHSLKIKWTKFHTSGVRKVDLLKTWGMNSCPKRFISFHQMRSCFFKKISRVKITYIRLREKQAKT